MSAGRAALADLPDWPALLGVDQAAAYCGMSRGSFELLVKRKVFPRHADLPIRRKLWHRSALDAALVTRSPTANDREARKAAWAARQNRPAHAR